MSSDSLELVKLMLENDPLVDEVESQKSLVEALSTNMRKVTMLLAVFVAVLLFISLILINNVVRLHIFARRFSIKTMQLVGATRGFIRKPFIRRAVFQGIAAAFVALGLLAVLFWFVHSSFQSAAGFLYQSLFFVMDVRSYLRVMRLKEQPLVDKNSLEGAAVLVKKHSRFVLAAHFRIFLTSNKRVGRLYLRPSGHFLCRGQWTERRNELCVQDLPVRERI